MLNQNYEMLNQVNNNSNSLDSDANGNMYGLVSLILYFFGTGIITWLAYILPKSLEPYISSLAGLCPLIGIIVMIIGRVKYPQNKFLKMVMWIIIFVIILLVVLFILFAIWCSTVCTKTG